MAIRLIEDELKEGALVLVKDAVSDLTMPDGLGGYLDDTRNLLGVVIEIGGVSMTIDTRNPVYGLQYAYLDGGDVIVLDSGISQEDAHKIIDTHNESLGLTRNRPKRGLRRLLQLR